MCAIRASADSQSAISTQQVGVIEQLVARAAEESMLVRSLRCDHVFEQALQLISPTGPGPQLDDHFDCHPAILLYVPPAHSGGQDEQAGRPASPGFAVAGSFAGDSQNSWWCESEVGPSHRCRRYGLRRASSNSTVMTALPPGHSFAGCRREIAKEVPRGLVLREDLGSEPSGASITGSAIRGRMSSRATPRCCHSSATRIATSAVLGRMAPRQRCHGHRPRSPQGVG
jgi:hypothetical protein